MTISKLQISEIACLEIQNIITGVFNPLKGFMTSKDYNSVVADMHLSSGEAWTIPVSLEFPEDRLNEFKSVDELELYNQQDENIATMKIEDIFEVDYNNDIKYVFGTDDKKHPGIAYELSKSKFRVGGEIISATKDNNRFLGLKNTPDEVKKIFKEKKWKTIVGFQTRNPLHKAHEYLQRVGLEIVDGLFIQPLLGWKKVGDFTPEAVVLAYKKMVEDFYPKQNVYLGSLMTPMRYAGPREAVFHAIIRKNFGCTHFIIGRDHAGVGGYYGKYDAQKLAASFNDLGIEIMPLCGPFYCEKCGSIVTEKNCNHGEEHSMQISGTEVRKMLNSLILPPHEYMRPEISEVLINLSKEDKLFVK